MKVFLLLLGCFACLGLQAQRRGVYDDVEVALQEPDKVRVLDLRGQELGSLPTSLNNIQNVEVILLGMKLRNLWLYPRAWKYKFHFKELPAGGYLHLQGRGGGEYYLFNNFETAPLEFCQFPKLRVLDIRGGLPFVEADTVATRMHKCRPDVIVVGGAVRSKGYVDPEADFTKRVNKRREVRSYLHSFKIKHY
ncbi:hypothetical protein [Hymenobacter lucidus]|uniref:Uncharacterized protein n=1 Tax=Hymenobacter lucidus TaxID=2880930 RepID=A0ABS8AN36_9BACT|nr:hypothetical protein [Hymenobacter lucidus]MCB2407458.1 hypothetical protein [Hymenobacter lucidus]